MTDWLISIPVWCLLGLICGVALIFLPLMQLIDYRIDLKKYGKEYADEMRRRY